MPPTETALIVPIPEAEEAVGPFRAALDPAASWGVPAHVTVLYPFLPPDHIDLATLAALRETVVATPRLPIELTHVGWFGDAVVWLAPRPDDPFRQLTSAVWQRFPEAPPYAGAYHDVVPHLTIGQDAPRHVLSEAAQAVTACLPISAVVGVVRLIAGVRGRYPWRTLHEFPLAPPGDPARG
jgi:2'-5' RNA ligase